MELFAIIGNVIFSTTTFSSDQTTKSCWLWLLANRQQYDILRVIKRLYLHRNRQCTDDFDANKDVWWLCPGPHNRGKLTTLDRLPNWLIRLHRSTPLVTIMQTYRPIMIVQYQRASQVLPWVTTVNHFAYLTSITRRSTSPLSQSLIRRC